MSFTNSGEHLDHTNALEELNQKAFEKPFHNPSTRNNSINAGAKREVSNGLRNGSHQANGFYIDDDHRSGVFECSQAGFYSTRSIDTGVDIIDIRRDHTPLSLANMIRNGLSCGEGKQKSMPSLALWDGPGLELFEEITHLPDYYLSWVETEVLNQRCQDIAQRIKSGSMIVDLGCGNTRKIRSVLQKLDDMGREVDYYAMDLSQSELQICVAALSRLVFKHVRCHGLLGNFEDAQAWLQMPEVMERPKCLLSLGSSIGNMPPSEAASFLAGFTEVLRCQKTLAGSQSATSDSLMIIGLDSCKDEIRVRKAYDDDSKLNARFLLNSLKHANLVLGYKAFEPKDWDVHGEWTAGGYSQWLVPKSELTFENTKIKAGERVHIVQSQKYNAKERDLLWEQVGLKEICGWPSQDASFGKNPMISLLTVEDGLQREDSGIGMIG